MEIYFSRRILSILLLLVHTIVTTEQFTPISKQNNHVLQKLITPTKTNQRQSMDNISCMKSFVHHIHRRGHNTNYQVLNDNTKRFLLPRPTSQHSRTLQSFCSNHLSKPAHGPFLSSSFSLSSSFQYPNKMNPSQTSSKTISSSSLSSSFSTSTAITQSLCEKLINNCNGNIKLSLAVAGGGSSAVSTLTSTNSASSIFISSNVLYDRYSFAHFISSAMKQNTKLSMTTIASNDCCSDNFKIYNDRNGLFGYCTSYASLLLAYGSLQSTMYCNKPLSSLTTTVTDTHSVDYNRYLGVGCTSTLVSQSKEERKSKIHITVINGFGLSTRYDIVLDNGLVGDEGSDEASDRASHTIDTRRDRMEEESITGAMIIWCIHHYLATTTLHTDDDDDNVTTFNEDDIGASLQQILNRKGDSIEITKKHTIQSNHGSNTIDAANYVVTQDNHDGDNSDSTNGRVAMLTPNYHSMKVEPILQIVIPSHPIIFPGSFNPVHIGHIALANAAIQTMSQKMKDEFMDYCSAMNAAAAAAAKSKDNSGIDRDYVLQDIWNSTDYFSYANCLDDNQEAQQGNNNLQLCPILFELSLTNADKPPMDAHEVKRRVEMFSTMLNDQVTNVTKNNDEYKLPKDWGVLLTSAPLFIDKVRLLREHLIPSAATYHQHIGNGKRMRLMTFVIGTDTMVRIINPKYYGNSIKNMIVAVREMGDLGAHFVVGGRLEQSKDVNNGLNFFVSGESELAGLPEDVKEIFTIIKEEDFRVDISSSEIRNKGQTV